jgi:hypothetical protein
LDRGARPAGPGADSAGVVLDASGLPVAPELPADWLGVRVADANEPCPACGHTTWDEVTAPDDSRGMRSGRVMDRGPMKPPSDDHYAGMEPTPFVVCCACGHEESIGVMRFASTSDQDAAENQRRLLSRAARASVVGLASGHVRLRGL